VRQPGSGPGYLGGGRGGGRGHATLGSRASGKPTAGTRGPVGRWLAGLFSERGVGLRPLAASVEEFSSSGRTCTDPLWSRARPSSIQFQPGGDPAVWRPHVTPPAARRPRRLRRASRIPAPPFVGTPLLTFSVHLTLSA